MKMRVMVWSKGALFGLFATLLFATPFVSADQYSSSNYKIDASVMNNFGGAVSSTNYKMVSSGGESIIGNGSSGSYILGGGYVSQLQNSLQLTVQPSGLVAHYALDEASGTATYDSSANSNEGGLQSGASWSTGKLSGAVDTTSADVQVADNATLPTGQSMTIELWAKQTAGATSKALLTQWDYTGGTPTSAGWALETSSADATKLRFVVGASAGDAEANYVDTPASSWSTGSWRHITVVYDGTQATPVDRAKVYIDGSVVTGTMTGTIPATLQDSTSYLDIGEFRGLNRKFNGSLDHVKIFNRSLTGAEVKAEYDAQNAGVTSGLSLATIVPGISNTSLYDALMLTDASGYALSVNQNNDLTSGAYTIPAISGTIASPLTWSESSTKGLGFTLVSTNATTIPGGWSSGAAYAAFPASTTSFYTRTGKQTGKDVLSMRLRADVASTQASGAYTNTVTITGTITP